MLTSQSLAPVICRDDVPLSSAGQMLQQPSVAPADADAAAAPAPAPVLSAAAPPAASSGGGAGSLSSALRCSGTLQTDSGKSLYLRAPRPSFGSGEVLPVGSALWQWHPIVCLHALQQPAHGQFSQFDHLSVLLMMCGKRCRTGAGSQSGTQSLHGICT